MELENDIDLFFSCGNLLIDPGCQALDSGPGLTLHVGGEGDWLKESPLIELLKHQGVQSRRAGLHVASLWNFISSFRMHTSLEF